MSRGEISYGGQKRELIPVVYRLQAAFMRVLQDPRYNWRGCVINVQALGDCRTQRTRRGPVLGSAGRCYLIAELSTDDRVRYSGRHSDKFGSH